MNKGTFADLLYDLLANNESIHPVLNTELITNIDILGRSAINVEYEGRVFKITVTDGNPEYFQPERQEESYDW